MLDSLLDQTAALVRGPFELENAPPPASEQDLLDLLAERISDMLEHRPEYLMSLLYRLDVEERKIRPVLQSGASEPPPLALARLVLDRQRQRAETRRTVKPDPLPDEDFWL